ncbi:MAG TPA: pirin family protein [Candidatus Binataceae bacterium]|jgi:redox-sensitive bicupin YhaK (pirin superfamily)|nr:pirin family protein [Candidatus Binataceae bacterium]
MADYFVLRHDARGHSRLPSTGSFAEYVAGHPDGWIERRSSFNFRDYQSGRPGFGKIRVFGDEVFSGNGAGHNMHPHHNFIIMAFVLRGALTHINTIGKIDVLRPGDYYIFSAGSGGKHSELNIESGEMNAIYIWALPGRLFAPPSYHRGVFESERRANAIAELIGEAPGALPIDQDLRVSRLFSTAAADYEYQPEGPGRGIYIFVLEGKTRILQTELSRRDSLGVWNARRIEIAITAERTDLLIVETAP